MRILLKIPKSPIFRRLYFPSCPPPDYLGIHEPLKYYLEIINFSKYGLKSKGMIYFEINKRFSSELKTELLNSKLNFSVKKDFARFPRFIKAKH